MDIEIIIRDKVVEAIEKLYSQKVDPDQIQIQNTRKDFEGDKTVVVFPFLRFSKKSPEQTGEELGNLLAAEVSEIAGFNVVKGFLNLVIDGSYWINQLNEAAGDELYGFSPVTDESELVMIEYSSPNTNKPLHLGHIRNNLLGFSISEIMKANGNKVVKTNIVNDRGIHICKSMYAWKTLGNGETPASSGKKGDHLVGEYYVKFDQLYKKEIAELVAGGMSEDEAKDKAPSIQAARDMLRKWEANDPEIRQLWENMNGWVYQGFDETYKLLGVDFDKIYYESDTYLIGRDEVVRGLDEGYFYRREDGSVWADLSAEGLDEKILLRSDGTSVYMTQDIGTAKMRYQDYDINHMIYVVGNEQNYHFQVLAILLDKLGYEWGKDLYHFSYGMVELPHGKMKSREGTVVDADDLVEEMIDVARKVSEELGKLDGYSEEEKKNIYRIVALGALKYFILKVDPRKNMLFNPEESIDFNGNTGPFIQYTYARIQSVLRKAVDSGIDIPMVAPSINCNAKEIELVKAVNRFQFVVKEAGDNHSPAIVANYVYDLVKEFNQFYHDYSIMNEPDETVRSFRLVLARTVGQTIKNGFSLLGIEVPERM
ncbi:arginine--tRNA ligase [Prolixibacter denitrificans]|uniref:Arginine--tRNA ligase n=1 Tax=Prolixibacter denitrificans TaxID=1541063 RepID=A0A2P8C6P3_9BACT|nr:arginine--tRNA ligase [Prolixibacter denitrificans]PSK80640.1 arginyl-tRNA synthetase [Prolixibacter denitrificans]GET22065.1 arginine--tRNA ligase [Prolixibacter denitrificans]